MPLTTGTRIGTYEISEAIGAGGMGEVYRARDTRLDRDVAIKILPELFAADPERLTRFEREAKTLASLNHPNIAHIYGVEESGSVRALVMELVEGPTLEEIIRGSQTGAIGATVRDYGNIAKSIADALEAAHERGIIHRDLKPANIKVRNDGTVKVLDFGLAKAMDSAPQSDVMNSPTFTAHATGAGLILGTAAYMSPEQANGKPVDKRTDIWSYGCVLFEMLSGRRPFTGETVTEVLTSIMRDPPDWTALPPTPDHIRRLLERCLEKDPKRRLRDIGDARLELDAASEASATVPAIRAASRPAIPLWALPAAIAATAAIAFGLAALRTPPPPERPLWRFEIAAPGMRPDPLRHPVISPNGQHVAWSAGGSLWIRDLDQVHPRSIANGADPLHLAWSPDSREVMFYSRNRLWRVRTNGGDPVVIGDASFPRGAITPGAAWLEDDRIIFAPASTGSGLLTISARGGAMQPLLEPPQGVSDFHVPGALPGNRGVLVAVDYLATGTDNINVFANGQLKRILHVPDERLEVPVYSPTGHVLFQRLVSSRGVWAVPFDLERLATRGDPFLVEADAAWPSVSSDGTLIYTRGDLSTVLMQLAVVDANGSVRPIGEPAVALSVSEISPDGNRVVATARDETGRRDLYVYDIKTGARVRVTHGADAVGPRWAGDQILFTTGGGRTPDADVAVVTADGSGTPRMLVENGVLPSLSPDNQWLLFYRPVPGHGSDIFRLRVDPKTLAPVPGETEKPLLSGQWNERAAQVSPKGGLLTYESEESGRREIYLTTFPDVRGKWQVSQGGVDLSFWHPAGDRILYVQGSQVYEVPITVSPATTVSGARRVVLEEAGTGAILSQLVDIMPDGRSFVIVRRPQAQGEALNVITVVQNWFEEFKR
jgi:Tol biopolymer transport system component